MMARFCRYIEKVFSFGDQIKRLSDMRPKPQIPTAAIFLSAFMMYVTHLQSHPSAEGRWKSSYPSEEGPGRWEKIVGKRKPSADRIGEVGALMDTESFR